jgi:glycosyltransferase involved in cell wall biosynthesis
MITVFTPTYNRAYILPQLYASLLAQSNQDFEWLIVDDGSTDDTRSLIKKFMDEAKISIRYIYQTNGGKHTAINLGVQEARGELFFIVDSDDYLPQNSLELLLYYYEQIKDEDRYWGLSGLRIYPNGKTIGGDVSYDILHCSFWDYRYKYKIKGDKADAFKTAILKEFPFPVFEGENFVSEVIVVNRIAAKYPLALFFAQPIYICEFLEDGLTAGSIRNRQRCSTLALQLYEEQSKFPLPVPVKMRSVINYWRFSFYNLMSFPQKLKRVSILYSLIGFPVGLGMYMMDRMKGVRKK